MATITVTHPDGRCADIDPRGDGHWRVLIGTAECCQIRLTGADVFPIHAYLAPGGHHYYLWLAPGARVLFRGKELLGGGERPASGECDLTQFEPVRRDNIQMELGGALIVADRG
jgi:hypothetical protein